MSISAMKQALDFLEWFAGDDHSIRPKHKAPEIAAALRQAIAETEKQEPVAFRNTETGEFCTGGFLRKDWAKWQPLYAAPPKREWVGLTDDEIAQLMFKCDVIVTGPTQFDFAQAIEAKLKEKNPVHASDEFKEMVEKGTKAWADTPDDWVDDLRGWEPPKREWVGLDPETMRNTTLEFNRGALWAERYLKEKNT